MSINKEYLFKLLSRFADNSISEKEYRELKKYIADSSSDDELFEAMDNIWDKLETGISFIEIDRSRVFDQILADPRFQTDKTAVKELKPARHWLRIAASLLMACSSVIAAYFIYRANQDIPQIAYLEKIVPKGQKVKLRLPDGSIVFLNADSKIRFPEKFAGKTRDIFLEGEAFFDVVHDPDQPFIVHARGINTQVLGTAFDIESYHRDEVSVAVLRGKVSVADRVQKICVLLPNDNLVYNAETKRLTLGKVNANDLVAWKDGELILDNVTMEKAAEIIGRWYNVEFRFETPELKNYRFNVSFLKGEKITKVMDVISHLNGFKYRIERNTIILSGRKHK
ncbi:DUF4974 domain-containing protein [Mucilaginibacter sp. cycad4]|uniref:FecR family protein n=1 Tax=Mucilaginibacter sp. cycad4 TaxID=3342096 RepID=UPI002AAA8A02|nr:FecR domain-containing protein [Mucilaginibacter gossypii]WPV01939.1 DUF4974 domain-containing protein [Mucilaginibacter gossypii]